MTPVPTFTAEQVTAIAKKAADDAVLAFKSQSGNNPVPAKLAETTSAVANSAFSNFGPYGMFYLLTAGAAVGFYYSRKPAKEETRAQCAAKDLAEILSKPGPLLGVSVAGAALSWPIISFIAPRLDGSWLKAASQHITNSNWGVSKMATALVTGLTATFVARSLAHSLQGPSKTLKANQELEEKYNAAKTAMTNWEETRNTTIPSKAVAAKSNEKQEERTAALADFAKMPLERRMKIAFNLLNEALVDKEAIIRAQHAQLVQPVHKPQSYKQPGLTHHAPADPDPSDVVFGDDEEPWTPQQVTAFLRRAGGMTKPQAQAALEKLHPVHQAQVLTRYQQEKKVNG